MARPSKPAAAAVAEDYPNLDESGISAVYYRERKRRGDDGIRDLWELMGRLDMKAVVMTTMNRPEEVDAIQRKKAAAWAAYFANKCK